MAGTMIKPAGRPALAAALVSVIAVAGLGACGDSQYTYVMSREHNTYFQIPSDWKRVDQTDLEEAASPFNPDSFQHRLRTQLVWEIGYDADDNVSVRHVFGTVTTDEPVVYAKVERLLSEEQNAISFDYLRNSFLPVTEAARRSAAQVSNFTMPGFEVVSDEIITRDGLHGVRTVYGYALPNGVFHTFDQTALVNDDSSLLYFLILRCSTRCYRDRMDEFNDIAGSFRVRSEP